MKVEKKLIVTLSLATVWLLLVGIMLLVTVATKDKTEEFTEQSIVKEEYRTPAASEVVDEIVYSNMTNILFNYDNILDSLLDAGIDKATAETVSYILSNIDTSVYSWSIRFNKGYCDTILLYVNDVEDEPYMTVMCFNDNVFVSSTPTDYIFCKDDVTLHYTSLTVQSLSELLNKVETDWNWNNYEAVYLYGTLDILYPNVDKTIMQDMIIVNGYPLGTIGNAEFNIDGTIYTIYSKIESDNSPLILEDANWFVPDVLTVDTILQWLDDNNYTYPAELDKAISMFGKMHNFWYIEASGDELVFYTVKVDSKYEPVGYMTYKMATYSYLENVWRF